MKIQQVKTKGWLVLDQIKALDRKRFVKKLGELSAKEIEAVKAVIMETYVA